MILKVIILLNILCGISTTVAKMFLMLISYDNHTFEFPIKYSNSFYHTNSESQYISHGVISLNNTDLNDTVDAIFLSDVELYHKFNNSSEESYIYLVSHYIHVPVNHLVQSIYQVFYIKI